MSGPRERMQAALEAIVAGHKLLGAALISRDGLCVSALGRLDMNRETFSAMSATVMGAAEIALGELQGGATRSIVASTDRATMVLIGVSSDLILVGYAPAEASVADVLHGLESAAKDVARAALEG